MNVSAAPAVGLAALKAVDLEEIKKTKHRTRKQKARDADAERFAKNSACFWRTVEYSVYLSEFDVICAAANGDPDAHPAKRTIKISEYLADVYKVASRALKDFEFTIFLLLVRRGPTTVSSDHAEKWDMNGIRSTTGVEASVIQKVGAAFRAERMQHYFKD